MRRKIIAFALMIAFALSNILTAYGAEWSDIAGIRPLYGETATYFADFDIDSNGNMEIRGTLESLKLSATSQVCAVVKITNVTTGEVVYNKTITMTYSKRYKKYNLNEGDKLTTKGTYQMNLTYKCYDGNRLLESIQVPSKLTAYA